MHYPKPPSSDDSKPSENNSGKLSLKEIIFDKNIKDSISGTEIDYFSNSIYMQKRKQENSKNLCEEFNTKHTPIQGDISAKSSPLKGDQPAEKPDFAMQDEYGAETSP